MHENSEASLVKMEDTTLVSITKGEVDMQVATAKTYPRSIDEVIKNAITLATIDQKTAESCFYAMPRAGGLVEGPSIRLAEIMASTWKNLRCEVKIIEEGRQHVTAQATTWDMENNVLIRIEAKRRIIDKKGNRYKPDMILMTQNAAISIALRNAVFRVIPRSIVDRVYNDARQVAFGNAKTMVQRRASALETFGKLGVSEERVLIALEKPSIEDINVEDLSKLLGLLNAIKENAATIEDAFPEERPQEENGKTAGSSQSRTDNVLKKLNGKTDKNNKQIFVTEENQKGGIK